MQTSVGHLRAIGLSVLMSALIGSVSAASAQVQQGLNNEEMRLQQGMATGMINGGQAAAINNQIGSIEQQQQMDRAMNGGHLTGNERAQIGAEMQGVNQNMRNSAAMNGYNPNMMGGQFQHHHHHQFQGVMQPYNQGYYPQSQYPVSSPGYYQGYNNYNGYNNYGGYGTQGMRSGGMMNGASGLLQKLF